MIQSNREFSVKRFILIIIVISLIVPIIYIYQQIKYDELYSCNFLASNISFATNEDKTVIILEPNLNDTIIYHPDINGDNVINISDLDIIIQHLNELTEPPYPPYDVNQDGIVNVLDLSMVSGLAGSNGSNYSGKKFIPTLYQDQELKKLFFFIRFNSSKLNSIGDIKWTTINLSYDGAGKKIFYPDKNGNFDGYINIIFKQLGYYPFETDCAQIYASVTFENSKKITKQIFALNETFNVSFNINGNYINIATERINKKTSIIYYCIGLLLLYSFLFFLYIHKNIKDFTITNILGHVALLYTAITFGGMEKYLFSTIYGALYTYVITLYIIYYFFIYLRIFYILPHLIQYLRVKVFQLEPFSLFRNSPVYWDDVIIMPLPFLSDFLVLLTGVNRIEGLKEIELISSKRPTQRKAASSALLEITIQDLNKFDSVKEIAQVSNNLSFLSAFKMSEEFSNAVRNIENISIDARSYLDSTSNYYKIRNLQILLNDVKKFQNVLTATKGPTGYKFHSVADKWYQIIEDENEKFIEIKKDIIEEIPNPYIFGTPVRTDDNSNRKIFVKRDDIIGEIESNLSNISQKPTLFLYGRRRVGKSSVLINLAGSLGKQYIPAYIDCQDARTTESISSFCYSLSKSISNALANRGYSLTEADSSGNVFFISIANPSFESFQKSPFTTLGNWFDSLEKTLEKEKKLILINLDEYEKLEESILRGTLPITILDQLRSIIQHRKYFVVLISGSRELSELKLNWSDYLISAKTIKLGYLPEDATRTLITNPIDDFSLNYDGGANGAAVNRIIEVTNCQPYLVQALCFELVNYMNVQQRREAKLDDVDAAIEKVLASANVYFYYIWKEECSQNEKELLLRLVKNLAPDGNEKDINSLVRKEIIEKVNGIYKFKVELMKKWIEKNEL